MNNSELINYFYESFSKGNSEEMVSCYHDDIIFQDPAFGQLQGEDAKNMWKMLIYRSRGDLKISFANVKAGDQKGSATWAASYHFGPTKRKVANKITAKFEFKEGKIIRHSDHFNLWKWCMQAFGWKGFILGWTPVMQNKIQLQSRKLLKEFTSKHNT